MFNIPDMPPGNPVLANKHTCYIISGMRKHIFAILFLFFLVVSFFSKGIFSRDHIFAPVDEVYLFSPWNEYKKVIPMNFQQADALFQFIPWRMYAYEQIGKGNFPLWNPYEYGGIPFFANDQSNVLSIFTIIGLPFSFAKGFLFIAILKLFIASLGMYLFLNLFSLSMASCIIGSIAYTFSALMITWLYHPLSGVVSFIPWLFWAFERLYRNIFNETKADIAGRNDATMSLRGVESRRHDEAISPNSTQGYSSFISLSIAAFIIALSFFSGHSETTANALFGIIIFYMTKVVMQHKKIMLSTSMLVAGIILGFLLAAVQILPFLQLLLNSVPFSNRSLLPNPAYTKIYLPLYSLILWLVPNIIGNPSFSYFFGKAITGWHEATPYIGIAPLLLGMLTLIHIKTDYKRLLPFWVMVFSGFGMAYGIPVIKWLTMLPLLHAGGSFRYIILMEFGLAGLSAFGLEMLMKHKPEHADKGHSINKALTILLATCLLALILYLITRYDVGSVAATLGHAELSGNLSWVNSQILAFVFIQIIVSILFISGTLWFIVKIYKRHIYGWVVPAGFIVLSITDLFTFGIGYNPDVPVKDFYPDSPIISKLKTLDTKDYSFYAYGSIIPPDTSMVYHLRDFRGYDMIVSVKYQNFLYLMFPDAHPNLGELGLTYWPETPSPVISGIAGIKYFIFPKSFNPDNKSFKLIDTYKTLSLWENSLALPLFYLARGVVPADDDSALQVLSKATSENLKTPVVQDIMSRHIYKAGKIKVTETGQQPGEHIFDVRANSAGFLVLNEPFYPGWHASVNDKPVTIYHTNYLFQGIELPRGNYTVRFKYKPGIFYTGLKISVATFSVMVIILLAFGVFLLIKKMAVHSS